MDIELQKELSELANEQIKLAREYYEARDAAGKAHVELRILLVAKLKGFRAAKSNIGKDMAELMLLEDDLHARDLYKIREEQTYIYKGLELLIEAIQSKISMKQSWMKYQLKGEQYGAF